MTLEGPEGAGKTTQSLLLADYLRNSGWEVVGVREPGGTAIGERIRSLLLDPRWTEMDARAEMLLFAAARAQLVAEVIAPALRAGKCVVCDRFVDTSLAYQGIGRRLGVDVVRAVNAVATGAVMPDLTLLLDIDPSAGLRRARAETEGGVAAGDAGRGDRMEQELLAFHERVREGFLWLAQNEPHRIKVIDARGPVPAVEWAIRQAVAQILRGREARPGAGGAR